MNRFILICFFCISIVMAGYSQSIRYVKPISSGMGDGSSWANASADLQLMINNSSAGDTIWVAQGTYKPIRPANNLTVISLNNRDNAFVLKSKVHIYGGFAGNETELSQRNWNTNPTVLSGDIGTPNSNTDNSYHVVISVGSINTCLDGFTITGGRAYRNSIMIVINGQMIDGYRGAGVYNDISSPILTNVTISGNTASSSGSGMYNINSSPILTNVTINGNLASYGGGMYNGNSSPILTNVTINGNLASYGGGGMYNNNSSSVLTNVIISENTAHHGGGMHNENSSPILTNVTISGNMATGTFNGDGGGISNCCFSSPILTNVTINGNSANNGGGMYNGNSSPILTNVTISGNSAITNGGGMYNSYLSSPQLRNSIILGNNTGVYNDNYAGVSTPTYDYCLVQGLNPAGTGNFNGTAAYPIMFVNAVSFTSAPTVLGNYRLARGNPVINAGNNTFNTTSVDLDSNRRISSGVIDLGAYEYMFITPDSNGIVYVNKHVNTGNGIGDSWYNAANELADALRVAVVNKNIKEIWVAEANYIPLYHAQYNSWQRDTSRNSAFMLPDSIGVYGGFPTFANDLNNAPHAGLSKVAARNTRNWETYPTILDGKANEPLDMLGTLGGAYHVVIIADTGRTSVLDGFIVRGGNANGTDSLLINGKFVYQNHGGGIYNNSPYISLANLTIDSNKSSYKGGGMYNADSCSVEITDINIINNQAVYGGGIYNGIASSSVLTDIIIRSNQAVQDGGGMYNNCSSVVLDRVEFSANRAGQSGGGIYSTHQNQTTNAGIYTNCLFFKNRSNISGGAIYYDDGNGNYPVFTNCTFSTDSSSDGNVIYYYKDGIGTSPLFRNCIIDSSASGNIAGGYLAGLNDIIFKYVLTPYPSLGTHPQNSDNILGQNPMFIDKSMDNYRLHPNSPAVNAGNKTYYESSSLPNISHITMDLDHRYRFNSLDVDLGAFEHQIVIPDLEGIVYVNKQVQGGLGTGETWADAAWEVADALQAARSNTKIDEIWVAESVYTPFYHAADGFSIDGGNKNAFVLADSVRVFGGFPTNANDINNAPHAGLAIDVARATRNWNINPTILSGYVTRGGKVYDTAYHVVISSADVGNACLDGFIIEHGKAKASGSLTVNGNTIQSTYGGGIYCESSSPAFANLVIRANSASGNGGGIYNANSSPTITNVLVHNNNANEGGGIYNDDNSSPILTNITVSGNSGGGVINRYSCYPLIRNTIVYGNTNYDYIWPFTAGFFHSLVGGENLNVSNGNFPINTDPLFVDATYGNYRLQYCSPAINSGNSSYYHIDSIPNISHIAKDLDNNSRIFNNEIIDLGAYEFQQPRIIPSISIDIHDTTVCYKDSVEITFTLTGTPNWKLTYTANNGSSITTPSILSSPYTWKLSLSDTTTYRFTKISDSHCDTVIRDSIMITVVPQFSFNNMFSNDTLCNKTQTTGINFSSDLATNHQWKLTSGDSISGIPTGIQTGNFGTYLLTNNTDTIQTDTITATPFYTQGSLVCTGIDNRFSVSVIPTPLVSNTLNNDTLCDEESTSQVIFTGVATDYTWQLSSLGDTILGLLLGQQTGNFNILPIENKTDNLQTSIIEVIPSYTLGSKTCFGADTSFLITVNPKAYVTNIPQEAFLCNEGKTTAVNFVGVATEYQWEVTENMMDSLPTGIQTGNFGEYALYNTATTPLTTVVHVIPYYNTGGKVCAGYDTNFSITVAPTVVITNAPSDTTYCHEELSKSVIFDGVFIFCQWEASPTLEDIPTGIQTGDFGEYLLKNATNSPLSTLINITPYYSINTLNCQGKDTSFSIVVNPKPILTNVLSNQELCDGEQTTSVAFASTTSTATQFDWTAIGTIAGLPTGTQTGNFGAYLVNNKLNLPLSSNITITPRYIGGGRTCSGEPQSFGVVVHPTTSIQSLTSNEHILCENEELILTVEAIGGNVIYRWYHDNTLLTGDTSKQYIVPQAKLAHSGYYYIEADGYCGDAKSSAIHLDVRSEDMLVEKWHDVILVDNSKEQYIAYQWYRNGIIIPGATNQFYQELGGLNGCYSVELTLKGGKKEFSCERCLDKTSKTLSVYPNPVKQNEPIKIVYYQEDNSKSETLSIEMYSMDGKFVFSGQMVEGQYEIPTHGLSQGVYTILLRTKNARVDTKKIVVY